MLVWRPTARIVIGLLLAILGAIWTLQGFDLLGQEGGMNGRQEWIVIGLVAVAAVLLLAGSGVRARLRS